MLKDVYINNSQIPKRYLQETKLGPSDADLKTFENQT